MLPIPDEIKEKLVKALDDENDVDDATVVEIVSVLEKYPITRATLEDTRIGKMVNDLRRKIKNEKLAKRVKQLVRNWKKILEETPSVNGGVPGPTHPAISQLRSSPAISPALSRVTSGRLVSPGQGKGSPAQGKVSPPQGRPSTPKQVVKKNASPALAGSRASPALAGSRASPALAGSRAIAAGSYKALSPGLGTNGSTTPSVAAQKVASPALPGSQSRVASPALVARTSSPTVSGRVLSPAVSSRVESRGVSGRVASPLISGRVGSPAAVGHGSTKSSPLLAQSTVQSLESQSAVSSRRERSMVPDRNRLRKVASTSELSKAGDKPSLSAAHSELNLDRLGGEMDKGRQDSDEEFSCRFSRAGDADNAHPHNHSIKTALSLNSNNKNYKDQRELSKTNMANRKRAREFSDSPPEERSKKARTESSSLSANSHKHSKVINGYTSKSGKKHAAALETPRVHSATSVFSGHSRQALSGTASEESATIPHSLSDSFLMHQESMESNLSAQSLERPSRDKHKVKTTEQLIEELQKKNNGSNVGNIIVTKLRNNQIEKEQDLPAPVLPAGMKPRGKRGRPRKNEFAVLPSPSMRLSQVKSELVERFLKTSDPSSPMEDYNPFKDDLLPDPGQHAVESKVELGACRSVCSKDNLDMASTNRQDMSEVAHKEENMKEVVSPPLPSTSCDERTGSALTLDEIYAQLPPVDDDIDWDAVDFFELPEAAPVTEEAVDRLHNDRLPGINGLYDINGDWTSWHQVVTLPAYEGNQLHILPYVDLDN